ncbi:MAG: alpha/beta hydrolase [Saprospiraceae bacterium]
MKNLIKLTKYFGIIIGTLFLALIVLGLSDIGNKYDELAQDKFRYLEIDNNRIRFLQEGIGKDIILLHGTPGSIEDWTPIIKLLAKSYRVTTYDRLGHGYSTNEDYSYHLKDNAELVNNIIQKLNLQSPMVIGHSYGGSTVAYLLANHYNDSLKYMIIDSPLFNYTPSGTYKLLSTPLIGKGVGLVANYTIAEQQIEKGVKSSFTNQSKSKLSELVNIRKKIWLQPKVLHSKAKESVNYQTDLSEISVKYSSISSDVIVVTGKDDIKTFYSECQKFSNIVPTDSLVVLENTGHYIQFDRTEDIVQLINDKMN